MVSPEAIEKIGKNPAEHKIRLVTSDLSAYPSLTLFATKRPHARDFVEQCKQAQKHFHDEAVTESHSDLVRLCLRSC
ncbi:MAG: hypothetical protein CMF38_07620 [Legionellaceae bacterium]|nr:hypothetical protein [Legionellaceae bacterium]MBJ16481.1 hypothetical protein [Legionellaceae bacterium]HCA89768.1 hypothetical protein [Legionellales bacterium]|tara:strand:- start:136 stop:366 length:231 start_codon:yes stop_codon:yes gene_type:complete